eukprot:3913760-Rhodomonas_salina.2
MRTRTGRSARRCAGCSTLCTRSAVRGTEAACGAAAGADACQLNERTRQVCSCPCPRTPKVSEPQSQRTERQRTPKPPTKSTTRSRPKAQTAACPQSQTPQVNDRIRQSTRADHLSPRRSHLNENASQTRAKTIAHSARVAFSLRSLCVFPAGARRMLFHARR